MLMSTYTDDDAAFLADIQRAGKTFAPSQLVVGLETVRASNGQPYSTAELAWRFKVINATTPGSGIGVWRSPIPDTFLPFLEQRAAEQAPGT